MTPICKILYFFFNACVFKKVQKKLETWNFSAFYYKYRHLIARQLETSDLRLRYSSSVIQGNSSSSVRSPPTILNDISRPQSCGSNGLFRVLKSTLLPVSGLSLVLRSLLLSGLLRGGGQQTFGSRPTKPHCDCTRMSRFFEVRGFWFKRSKRGWHSRMGMQSYDTGHSPNPSVNKTN